MGTISADTTESQGYTGYTEWVIWGLHNDDDDSNDNVKKTNRFT